MADGRTTLHERIAFAEGWLDRARQQLEDGRVAHGALTLMLAEAELRRAREARLPALLAAARRRPRTSRGRSYAALGVGLAVAMLGAMALTAMRTPPVADAHDGPIILRLSDASGQMLRMVTIPSPAPEPLVVERRVIRSVVVRVPVGEATRDTPPARPTAAPAVSPAAPPAAVLPPPSGPVPPSVTPVTPPAPTLLSEADVIDLVLAAERSLRRSANQ
ncbi:MAG: hypothetical protein QN187_11115 [Armatimonadota bacterium]|nr:hypothetical protein [Armatimonadota bacterium]MDR7519312.1 hypothetical protein [Armatimonadota bacterium]MDR7550155.1 hypothetical protein [Armatimonadota bacterium]